MMEEEEVSLIPPGGRGWSSTDFTLLATCDLAPTYILDIFTSLS